MGGTYASVDFLPARSPPPTPRPAPPATASVRRRLFERYAAQAGLRGRSVHSLRHSIAVHLLEAARGIEYVADHLGHRQIANTRVYAQISHPLREQVFRDLERHPKIVRIA